MKIGFLACPTIIQAGESKVASLSGGIQSFFSEQNNEYNRN